MKRRSIRRPEPETLTLDAVAQDDRTLPKLRGHPPKTGKLSLIERRNLEADFRSQQAAQTLGRKRRPEIRNPSTAEIQQMQAEREQLRLEATKHFGGLIPEFHDTQFWQCSECGSIHQSRGEASVCHAGATTNRIQVCSAGLHRLGDCTCGKVPKETAS